MSDDPGSENLTLDLLVDSDLEENHQKCTVMSCPIGPVPGRHSSPVKWSGEQHIYRYLLARSLTVPLILKSTGTYRSFRGLGWKKKLGKILLLS